MHRNNHFQRTREDIIKQIQLVCSLQAQFNDELHQVNPRGNPIHSMSWSLQNRQLELRIS